MAQSTVGSLLRSTQAYCSQLCEKQTLNYGIAYSSARFAKLPEANQFREVVVDDPAKIPSAFDEAEQWFSERNLYCRRWALAVDQPIEELADFLKARGFRRRTLTAMVLAGWVDLQPASEIRILPARAMRTALRETFLSGDDSADETSGSARRTLQSADESASALLADATNERLDDAAFDMFVALDDKKPAGRCALYQVGDIARVTDLFVLPAFADGPVGHALLAHVLTLARRLMMRTICLQVEPNDRAKLALFEEAGFVADGEIIEFERGAPPTKGATGGLPASVRSSPTRGDAT